MRTSTTSSTSWRARERSAEMPEPGVLRIRRDNLVERPWGGVRLFDFKGLAPPPPGRAYGESFEVAADPGDQEAREHPSVVVTSDGREIPLIDLLRATPESILGRLHPTSRGPRIPLLPKFLDVREMLSVQAHPPGYPEVYLIMEAEPGATIRLGFRQDVDLDDFGAQLRAGRRAQEQLLARVPDPARLPPLLGPWLTARPERAAAIAREVAPTDAPAVEVLLAEIARVHRLALDALNEIPVAAGQIIVNATPDGCSADVHALGNPEGRGILLFEIRLTCRTFRLWDHARVDDPGGRLEPRPLHLSEALAALSGRRRDPGSFLVTAEPIEPGILRVIDGPAFAAVLLRPRRGAQIFRPAAEHVRTVHVLSGAVLVDPGSVTLRRGESAVIPAALGGYTVAASEENSEVAEVSLPAR